MKTQIIKLVAGTVTIGGLSVAAYQGYSALSSTEEQKQTIDEKITKEKQSESDVKTVITISSRISKKGYVPLDSQSTYIDEALKGYKKVAKNNAKLRFGDFTGEGISDEEAKKELLRLCGSALGEDDSEDSFKRVSKWCVAPVAFDTMLMERGKTAIGDNENSKWDEKIKKHKETNNNLTKLNLTGLSSGSNVAQGDYKIIQDECKKLKTTVSYDENFETALDQFSLWCAKDFSFSS